MSGNLPGKGFSIFNSKKNLKVGVLNLMGNVFMKKSDDVFKIATEFIAQKKISKDYDFLIVDFHGEITSEKMAIGNLFDGYATLVVGTHTHVPTNDARVLKNGTSYITDAGMCGDYDSVIGTKKEEFVRKFATQDTERKRVPPADGEGTLCGVIIESNTENYLAKSISSIRIGGKIGN